MSVVAVRFGDKLTPEQLFIDALEEAETYKMVVVITLDEDDYIYVSTSDGSALKKLGMCSFAERKILDSMRDD